MSKKATGFVKVDSDPLLSALTHPLRLSLNQRLDDSPEPRAPMRRHEALVDQCLRPACKQTRVIGETQRVHRRCSECPSVGGSIVEECLDSRQRAGSIPEVEHRLRAPENWFSLLRSHGERLVER